ncbi:CsbD family protein [Paraburkholderia azotifigens]|uniref:CsbD family protein n=2 Tax=Paraburkholderia azotifigens TaxID=2057004 RepID=A0ABU9R2A0_9BURK
MAHETDMRRLVMDNDDSIEGRHMETTKTEGVVREAAGNVKETIGSLAGDVGMQIEGKADELRGKAQQLCADATDIARDAISSSPLAVLAGAVAAGFALGALWAANRHDDV